MQLGTILDGAKHKPSVVEPVKFKIGHKNAQEQKTCVEVEAVLVYVSDEEMQDIFVAVDKSLSERFEDHPPPPAMRELELRAHFLAESLREKSDPAKPFATPDELRGALIQSVGDVLMDRYRAFVQREYHVHATDEEIAKLKEQATGK